MLSRYKEFVYTQTVLITVAVVWILLLAFCICKICLMYIIMQVFLLGHFDHLLLLAHSIIIEILEFFTLAFLLSM